MAIVYVDRRKIWRRLDAGAFVPTHGRTGAGEHLRQSEIAHLSERRNCESIYITNA